MKVKRIIVHPTHVVQNAASFTHEVGVVREYELRKLVKRVREFFKAFEQFDFKNLSVPHIQTLVNSHELSVMTLLETTTKKLKNLK